MKTVHRIILLASVSGLMFFVIPIKGVEFDFSWQLAAIWLGGIAFSAFLSSWWQRTFFLLTLVRTATIWPADIEAYMALLMIAIFLTAVEGFRGFARFAIDRERLMNSICLSAVALLCWVVLQRLGVFTAHFNERSVGPFNPDAGGVFLALCLIASLRRNWFWLSPFIIAGIVSSHSSTAMLAAAAGCTVYLYRAGWNRKHLAIAGATLAIAMTIWFWRVDTIESVIRCPRWIAWKHAAWSLRSESFGRGLMSWKTVFPLLASGDKRVGTVENQDGKIVMTNVFAQAHNEYVQTVFELGVQTLLLIIIFLAMSAWIILRYPVDAHAAAGIAALSVACFGWHVFHVPPLALLGSAWLGIWQDAADEFWPAQTWKRRFAHETL